MDAAKQASVCAEFLPGEELVITAEGFSIFWEPSPHKRGVDFYPVITNTWIAATTMNVWIGTFYQTNASLSARDNLKWATVVPVCLTKPYVVSPDIAECFALPYPEVQEARAILDTFPGVGGSGTDRYNWHMIIWQLGEMIGSSRIDQVPLHRIELVNEDGDALAAFSRNVDFSAIANEINIRRSTG